MNTVKKTGIWLIGAYGDIATTLIVGKLAIQNKLASDTGLITAAPPLNQLNLVAPEQLVFGGHDISDKTLYTQAEEISQRSRTFSTVLVQKLQPQLAEIDANIHALPELSWEPGNIDEDHPHLQSLIQRLSHHINAFIDKHSLDRVIMVNLASAEAYLEMSDAHRQLDTFEQLLKTDNKDQVLPSMLCAYVALQLHCPYINFTPNTGVSIDALQKLATDQGGLYYGNDGKTGETLLKTALAPMFVARNLRVMSWEGTNLLGNNDGYILNDEDKCKNKINNKGASLSNILGYPLHAGININYVPSLGDWKTAWDLIHFQGFLDVPMTMQFTWQGCDSILAAPLILDMVRLADFAACHEETGPMTHLACFFKNPIDIEEHSLHKQFEMLLHYTYQHLNE